MVWKNNILLIIIMLASVSCNRHVIRDYIESYYAIEENRGRTLCLNFKEILEVDFTEYYLLDDLMFSDEISRYVGRHYSGRGNADDKFTILFFDRDKLVYKESFRQSGTIRMCYFTWKMKENPRLVIVPIDDVLCLKLLSDQRQENIVK